ncbi:hypothetical protein L1987_34613 [Smallanthus sonchifolius]|uniref:Uncharacterized protein n=1 Tax=Smallanthus sonchifolius TaxID=185202 RepID=A0ACB9HUB3_9ASTR|nr:hypothetical protein L1987_34613 [Smallanthus sonchifolius]
MAAEESKKPEVEQESPPELPPAADPKVEEAEPPVTEEKPADESKALAIVENAVLARVATEKKDALIKASF